MGFNQSPCTRGERGAKLGIRSHPKSEKSASNNCFRHEPNLDAHLIEE